MKMPKIVLWAGVVLLLPAYAATLLEITTKKESYPEKHLTTQRTYRGGRCILFEMTENGKRTRVFTINGKAVAAESDEDNDGFFESLMIIDPETGDFEWFTRATNNIVRPVASEKLQEAKAKKKLADQTLSDLLKTEGGRSK